ncbi:glycosyl hydrolase family 28-related protein [Cronobacter malonaticus]|uniref:tail fiber/spike domain-containing protein n=1 Tax=Cronobacter malonaticus TaxID=413503 RepID=UPI0013755137|nr:glycosyl hydrolase family 28-related protein [Cronobacter malonaticus]
MATQPTNLPVPSESPRDLKFNAGKIDEFVTSMVNTYIDRFGNKHYTIEGLRWLAQQAIANYGWILKESFEDGYTITLPNEALLWESNGEYYRWDGALPKEVPAGSTPESTGGIGVGAWIGIGDAALKTMLASTAGSSMIGMEAGGTLKDVIKWITPEQFGAKGDGTTNDTASIQAAIDWAFNNGGGVVRLGPKVYRAANLTLKPRVVIEGATKETSMIMAPNGWTGNAVIMGQGYLTYKTDSASQVVPACYSSGLRNVTVHGNKSNYSGTPAKDVGCGVLLAGANIILDNIKIIYVPSVGLVTLDWGTNRNLYMAADPNRGWAHIGMIRTIRIQFCGNDCWHCEAQDYFLDDVEIVGAGDGFTSATDTFSFWQPDELVANFRVWRNVDLGFFHSYGNYNGYGIVAGGNTATFFIRIKYDSLILESCCVAGWFKSSSYVQGGKLDYHEISQQKLIAKHGSLMPAALIIECSNTRASNFGSVECVQSGGDATIPDYSGVLLYMAGQFNTIECLKISRSPTVGAALRGTGVVLEGANNRISSGVLKGFFGTDNRVTPSSCIVASSGYHYINIAIGFANVGVRLVGGHLQGEIKNMGGLTTWQIGMESETTHNRAMLKLYSDSGSNIGIIRGGAGAVNTGITTVQTISITGLSLPYLPAASEVTPHIVIDASNGSSIPPQVDSITYIASSSTVNQLTFLVRLTNSNSPMQVTIGARLN